MIEIVLGLVLILLMPVLEQVLLRVMVLELARKVLLRLPVSKTLVVVLVLVLLIQKKGCCWCWL